MRGAGAGNVEIALMNSIKLQKVYRKTHCCLLGRRAIGKNLRRSGRSRAGQQECFNYSSFCRWFFQRKTGARPQKQSEFNALRNFSRENFARQTQNQKQTSNQDAFAPTTL
jgi:hypothetical protein